jgi:hypothetical protein
LESIIVLAIRFLAHAQDVSFIIITIVTLNSVENVTSCTRLSVFCLCVRLLICRRLFPCFRKATRNIVDAWLVSHASASSCGGGTGSGGVGVGSSAGTATVTSAAGNERSSAGSSSGGGGGGGGNSGTTTPVRKISAHEFERGGLKSMVTTVDGTPTFLVHEHQYETPVARRRSRHELRQLDEKQLVFELVRWLLPGIHPECGYIYTVVVHEKSVEISNAS